MVKKLPESKMQVLDEIHLEMLKLFNSNGVGSLLSSWTEGWIENDSRCVCVCVLPAELLLFPIDSVSLPSSQNSVCRLCSTQYSPS